MVKTTSADIIRTMYMIFNFEAKVTNINDKLKSLKNLLYHGKLPIFYMQ